MCGCFMSIWWNADAVEGVVTMMSLRHIYDLRSHKYFCVDKARLGSLFIYPGGAKEYSFVNIVDPILNYIFFFF